MNTNPRQLQLLEEVRTRESATVGNSSLRPWASPCRPCAAMCSAWRNRALCTRFHGGVRVPSSTVENLAHTQRETLHAEGKARIARAVAEQEPNHCSLILNIGTTTEAIAKALLHHRGLRVITNNLNVAASHPQQQPRVRGHRCWRGGARARPGHRGRGGGGFIRQFKVDIALIGISGIEPDGSLRDFDYREVKVAQTIIEQAREVWLAADHSKFNRPAMVQLATLNQIGRLFTDAPPPEPFPALLQDAGVICTVAA